MQSFDEDRDQDYDPRDPILTKVQYAYDALGRRIGKRIERSCRRFKRVFTNSFTHLVDEDRILLGKDGLNRETLYVDGNGIDEHLAKISRQEAKSFYTDHLGSVLNDEAAGLADHFGPFGESVGLKLPIHALADPAQYGFTGRSLDLESGVYYYRARMYDSRVGRFLTKDPIGFEGGDNNLYRYAANRPNLYTDPTGTFVPAIVLVPIGGSFGHALVCSAAVVASIKFLEDLVNLYSKQDKKLSEGEIKKLKESGQSVHKIKEQLGLGSGDVDLYKDKDGNIVAKPKGGNGPGEPIGININDL